jgi:DnaA-homolog protein
MQLALDLLLETQPTLENFVVGANAELLNQIKSNDAQSLYLWGEPASGKTHMLKALCRSSAPHINAPSSSESLYIAAKALPSYEFTALPAVLAIDDLDFIDPHHLDALFALQNKFRASSAHRLVIASRLSPKAISEHLGARDDVASRLAWGLTLKIQELSDEDKHTAIAQFFQARGAEPSPDVIPYMLTHHSRNIKDLAKLADGLDRFALTQKRAITLPLFKQYLNSLQTLGTHESGPF